ncbi:MAG: tetratricopeptide repeat protein [Polyangiaceae bacterium]
MRAARVVRRFAPDQLESVLAKARTCNPLSRSIAAACRVSSQNLARLLDALEAVQDEILGATRDRTRRGALALAFGTRWATRHQNVDVGSRFLEEAVTLDAANEGAFNYLKEVLGKKSNDWSRIVGIAEEALSGTADGPESVFMLAQAGSVAWRNMGDIIRARAAFERLAAIAPEHPELKAYETQIGGSVSDAVKQASVVPPLGSLRPPSAALKAGGSKPPSQPPSSRGMRSAPPASERPRIPSIPPENVAPQRVPSIVDATEARGGSTPPPARQPSIPPSASSPPPARQPSIPPAASSPPPPPVRQPSIPDAAPARQPSMADAGTGDPAKIAELRALLSKQEAAKRFPEFVKTLMQLAAIVPEPTERVELYMKAADLYVNKFANQAEAVKAYEQVVALDPNNDVAINYLREMYGKRRDWEKLLGLERREAESLEPGPQRAAKFLEIAKLATERVKKPEVCIDLWREVLASDGSNVEALGALAGLYERSKEFGELVSVLEKQAEVTYDAPARIQILSKLGTLYGDRLNNDEGAVAAWRALLQLDPNDRKAQEALKKKYLALGMWDDLEVFYAESGKWDEFIRVLEQQEAKEAGTDAKIGLLFKIAELWADKKQKLDRAAKAYEKVLDLDGESLRAAEALIPIYRQANNAKSLGNVLEVKLRHEDDAFSKLEILRDLAVIYEGRTKEPQKAFDRYQAAFELAPTDEKTSGDMERLAKAVGGWESVITSYRKVVDQAANDGDRELAGQLRLKLGRVLIQEVNRVDDALAMYREVYEADPDNEEAMRALEGLYRQVGRFEELLGIYEKRRDLAVDADEKKAISYEIAKLYETELKNVDKAVDTYVAVLDDEPADPRALEALDVLYKSLSRWEPYADVLRKRIELDLGERELIDLKYRLGQALETHLGDAAGALENYREILFLDAQHDAARGALEGLLDNADIRSEAAAILEPIYEERGDATNLVRALEILQAAEGDTAKRVTLLRKIARIASESLQAPSQGFDALSRALKEAPESPETRLEIENAANEANSWPKLVALYGEIAEGLSDAALARDYWMRIASVDEQLGEIDPAAAAYTRVLAIDSSDEQALAGLENLFARTERFSDLIGVIERRIELASEQEERESLFGRIANIYDERLGQPDRAIASYRKVLDLDPTSHSALRALDALYTRQKLWPELAENLEAQLGLAADDDSQIAFMLRLASLRETSMGQLDVAIEGYRTVLERDATNATALAALERLGQAPEHEVAIAEILEPLYRQTGDYAKLVGVHEVQVRRADDDARKVELLHQIAQLHEDAAGDLASAFSTHARALSIDPANETTQRALDRVARATGRFEDLARAFETEGKAAADPTLASSLVTMAAVVYESDLGNVDTAVALYRRVLEIDPANLNAAESLERLFRSTERYEDLSAILQKKASIVDDVDAKKEALFQAASIEEDVLARPDAAIAVYDAILEIDAEDLRAVDALVNQYLTLSRWDALLATYAKKVDLTVDADTKKRIFFDVGAVYEREKQDTARAIETYQKILEIDPDDTGALERLDVLFERTQNWPELLTVLTRESELAQDADSGIGFRFRIAQLYDTRTDDVARAIELYRDILTERSDHTPTIDALEVLKNGSRDALGAAAVLEPIYEGSSAFERLVSVHEVQVRHADDPFQKVELLHRIARLHEDALENHASAFDAYSRALAEDSANADTLQNLERLAMTLNRWVQVAVLYDAELAKLGEQPDRFVELGLRASTVFETQLEDVDGAIARYQKVLEVEPENQTAIRALDRLFTMTERWAELAQVLARETEVGQTPDEILEFKYRLGQVQQHRLSDVEAAVAAYRDIINAAPEHQPALEALEGLFASGVKQVAIAEILEPLYRANADWEKLVKVHEAQLAHTTGQEERLAAYYQIAELFEEKIGDPVQTLDVYIRALKEFPLDERAGDESPRLANGVDGGFDTLANAYADIVGVHTDPLVQRTIGKRLARTFEEQLGDVTKAEETYKYVLGVDAKDVEALAELDRIYTGLGAWQELSGILEMRVKATDDTNDLVELYSRLGEVYEAQLSDVEHAIVAYRRIFDDLEKTHEATLQALSRIYEGLGAWTDLNAVYERELENAAGDAAEADIRAKIAHLAAEKLNDPQRAVETWQKVLDLRGEDPEALDALANLHERGENWQGVVDILERQADIANEDDTRVNIRTRRARIWSDRLKQDDQALEDWNRVLDIDYANLAALRSIAAIRRRQDDPNELTQALHQIVDRASSLLDGEELVEIFREMGRTYTQRLEQPFDAAEAWKRLLDVAADFEAFDALETIYRADERWTDVIDVKMRRADALEDATQKIEELRSVAALWRDQVGEADSARPAYEKILSVDPAHDEAFFELEKLHREQNRWEPLVELYLARLETREAVADRTALLRNIAHVFEEQLGDKNQALDALVNALAEDFHDRETARYLERMAQATGRWGEIIQTVNTWLTQQTEARQKIRLCLHLAKWYGDDLNHPEYAQPYYAQIVQLEPNNVGALRQMAQLFRKSANWQQQGTTLTRALDVAVTDGDRKEILTELGELLDGQMGQTDQAVSNFTRALEIDPHFVPAIEQLERIYGQRGQNKELVDVLHKKVPGFSEPTDIATTKLRIASLYESNLNDPGRAAQMYREVLDLDASSMQALRGLARVLEATEQWTDLVKVLEQELDVVATEREKVDLLKKIAWLHEEFFLKSDVAAQRLEQALEIDPNNDEAYVALARNYRKLRQWHDLIAVYERHISAALDKKTKVDLYGSIATVYADEIQDVDRAIDAYRNMVDLDEQNIGGLEALSKLYEKTGDAAQAIEAMTRVAELTPDTKQRVEAFYRIGKATDEKLGDRVSAQDRYEMAIELDPAHLPSLAALRQIAVDNADYDKAARFIDQEQSYTQTPRARARLLVELGKLREESLGDHASAILAWESAHEVDPENEDAAMPLVDEYIATEQWEKAEPLLDLLVRKAGKRERSEQHALNNKLGQVSAALSKDDKAWKAYSAAHQLDLTDQTTIRGLAEVSFRLKDWGSALTNYQKVLTALGEEEAEQRAEVYFKLGCVKREQGQAKQAINNFDKALAVDATHRPTLDALVSLYTELKDWKQVVAYKRQVLDNVYDGDERFKMLVEIGDIWNDNDKNALKAIEALEEARDQQPNNHPLLHKLLALYQATENWAKMIDTITAIAEMEKDPIRKSKFLYTIAQLYRDKENDSDRAVDLFNEALDLNPTYLEAFERINKILTQKKDWKALERAFRKMLRRLSTANAGNPDLEFNLWHNLGLIYRDRLTDMNSAIEAFKMATRFKPDEAVERQILAELFEATDQIEGAIGEHSIVLQKDPLRVDPYRSLYKLYTRMHEYDRAWCMCAALAFLKKADDEEQKFFEDYRPRGMIQVKSKLDNEQWVKNLFHKDENIFIGKIFEMITPAAIQAKIRQLQASKQLPYLDKKFKQDPATSTVTFAKTFGWAAQVLGIPTPELYVHNDRPGALAAVASAPVASVAGQTVLTGFTPQELTFIVGKHLAYYRGEHYIRNLFPTMNELKVLLFCAIKLVMPDFAVPAEMAQAVTTTATELQKYIQPIQRDSLRLVVQKFIEDGARADLKRWMQTTEVTSARAGLLLCADLEIAKKIIAAEPQLPGDLSPQDKMKELLVFSVSEQYFALRKALQIAVG